MKEENKHKRKSVVIPGELYSTLRNYAKYNGKSISRAAEDMIRERLMQPRDGEILPEAGDAPASESISDDKSAEDTIEQEPECVQHTGPSVGESWPPREPRKAERLAPPGEVVKGESHTKIRGVTTGGGVHSIPSHGEIQSRGEDISKVNTAHSEDKDGGVFTF